MCYYPIKFETRIKPVLGFKSYDTHCVYFQRISNCRGSRSQFQMSHVSSVKHSYFDWIFCFSWSKLILKAGIHFLRSHLEGEEGPSKCKRMRTGISCQWECSHMIFFFLIEHLIHKLLTIIIRLQSRKRKQDA